MQSRSCVGCRDGDLTNDRTIERMNGRLEFKAPCHGTTIYRSDHARGTTQAAELCATLNAPNQWLYLFGGLWIRVSDRESQTSRPFEVVFALLVGTRRKAATIYDAISG